jgi:hypothetical protein
MKKELKDIEDKILSLLSNSQVSGGESEGVPCSCCSSPTHSE